MEESQLRWIAQHREVAESAASVGRLAQELMASGRLQGPAWRRRILSVLEENGAEELLGQASLCGIRNGVLTFEIAEPAARYHLRLQWEQRLLRLMQVSLPAAGVTAVRFACVSSS